MSTRHLIITRFDLYRKGRAEDWLDTRWEIFNKYTAPSIQRQTNQNFDWILLIGDHTSQAIEDTLWEFGIPMRVSPPIWPVLATRLDIKEDWLLTTRLDSDDYIHPRFVELLQKHVIKLEGAYNFPKGCKTDGTSFYHAEGPNNPFISYMEPNSKPKTVYHQKHGAYNNAAQLAPSQRMWCMVCHNGNILNRIGNSPPIDRPQGL